MKPTLLILAILMIVTLAGLVPVRAVAWQDPKIDKARAQVSRVVEDLDRRTTATGVYVRAGEGEIKETDPWGRPLQVVYTQGGLAERVLVRSAGPDGEFHSSDDIQALGISANLRGIGEGIKQGAEQTAHNVAKGVVKGTVAGVKETIKESLPRRKAKEQKPQDDANR